MNANAMTNPLISVIVPVFNTEPYLRKCLESICTQSYRNLEIICVDDGSSDGSLAVLQEFADGDPRVQVLSRRFEGVAAARNAALDICKGDYITGVDSDDFLEPGIYEKALPHMQAGVDAVVFNAKIDYAPGMEPNPGVEDFYRPKYEGNMELNDAVICEIPICIWNKLWKRSIVEEHRVRFPHGLIHEDEAFYFCFFAYARTAYFMQDCGYHYVQRPRSIMHTPTERREKAECFVDVCRFTFGFFREHGLFPARGELYLHLIFKNFSIITSGVSGAEYRSLQDMFAALVREQGLQRLFPRDYRLKCLVSAPRWKRLFVTRRPLKETYRFFGFPLWSNVYREGKLAFRTAWWLRLLRK